MSYNVGRPIRIFVHRKNELKAMDLINEDRSKLLEDPDLDFGELESNEEDKVE